MSPTSAIPDFYYAVFGVYEPLLVILSAFGTLIYPKEVHDQQAPWPQHLPAQISLPPPTLVTIIQLAHVVGLLGLVNTFLLYTARRYLFGQPAIQEKVVSALLTPLMLGDVLHLAFTFYALGDDRWNFSNWSNAGTLWVTVITGFSLLLPRLAWHLGIGRYVDSRDRKKE